MGQQPMAKWEPVMWGALAVCLIAGVVGWFRDDTKTVGVALAAITINLACIGGLRQQQQRRASRSHGRRPPG